MTKKPLFFFRANPPPTRTTPNVTCVFRVCMWCELHYLLHRHAFIIIIVAVYNNNNNNEKSRCCVRENDDDEWKRKEKSGKNREIHCSITASATRAYILLMYIIYIYIHLTYIYIIYIERIHTHIIVYEYIWIGTARWMDGICTARGRPK